MYLGNPLTFASSLQYYLFCFLVSTQNVKIHFVLESTAIWAFSHNILSKHWIAILPKNKSYKDFSW